MTAPASKICVICRKDVSNAPRVKDPAGHYFCPECHQKALQKHAAGGKAAVAAGGGPSKGAAAVAAPPKPAADDDDLLPLVPVTSKPATPKPAAAAEAPKGPPKIPEFCPNCGTKTLAGRRLCFKCNRDVTQMDKLVAMRAQQNAPPGKEEKIASVMGVIMKIGLILFCTAVVVFIGIGVWWQMKPPESAFEDYPTTREKVVRDFLSYVNQGTDSSYKKAFLLVSFRERTSTLGNDELKYVTELKKMHDDFVQKYGADWHSKYQLELAGPDDNYADDEVDYTLKLGADSYRVATQVQMSVDIAGANMMRPMKVKPTYPEEGGKNHYGILDVQGYTPYDKRVMVDRIGVKRRPRPEDY
jgi:hypothetical protein